jgi:hypothetical protein
MYVCMHIYIHIYIAEMFKYWKNKTDCALSIWQNVKTKTNTLLYTRNLIMTEYGVITQIYEQKTKTLTLKEFLQF